MLRRICIVVTNICENTLDTPNVNLKMEVFKLGKQYVVQHHLLSLMAELVLDQAVRDYEISRLYKEIDQALEDQNKERFLHLTNELKNRLKT